MKRNCQRLYLRSTIIIPKVLQFVIGILIEYYFVKIPILESYAITHKFDLICLTETFLDSSYSNDDTRLQLAGYSLLRVDHPMNIKRGWVCIYYKEHLPLICKPNLTPLDECLVCELKVGNKKCFITVLFRSPRQSLE